MPEVGNVSIVTIDASDLKRNSVSFLGATMPIFADGSTCYKGQPVMAVFAETLDTAQLFAKQVRIRYGENEPAEFSQTIAPLDWKLGNTEPYFSNPDNKVFCSSFRMASHKAQSLSSNTIECEKRGSRFFMKASTQWPKHLKRSVAESIGTDEENIVMYAMPYYAPYDNLIVLPSVMAPIAAAAAEKCGTFVQLVADMTSYQPDVMVTRTSCYNSDNSILAEKIDASADLGAWPLFAEEYVNSMLAGFVASTDTEALDVHITLRRSPEAPASFFGDLGYAAALASTQNHMNKFCRAIDEFPTEWSLRNLHCKDKPVRGIRRSPIPEEIAGCIRKIDSETDFGRKHRAYNQKSRVSGLDTQIVNYERGMGFAFGESINGFSSSSRTTPSGGVSVILHENGDVMVSCGIPPKKSVTSIWKKAISSRLGVKAENIDFFDINDPDVEDIGPAALSRSVCVVTPLIEKACDNIASRIGKEDYPISARASIQQILGESLYRSTSAGAMGIDLHMDPVTLAPVIDRILFRATFTSVESPDGLETKIRHIISNTVYELCPLCPGPIDINIRIDNAGLKEHAGSATSMIRGLTAAALADALSQALGHDIDRLPVTIGDLLNITSMEESL